MSPPNSGRLEAQLVFAADQTFELQWKPPGDVPITQMRTVSAGAYFPSELCGAMADAIFGPSGSSVTIDVSELGTGRVTIAMNGDAWHIAFGSATELRDALGFDNDIYMAAPDLVATGIGSARGLWLPGTQGKFSKHGDYDHGKLVTDFRQTVGPTGSVHALSASSYRVHEGIMWEGVPANRARAHREIAPFESYESFFLDVALGRVSFIPVNAPIRLYWRTDDPIDAFVAGHLLWPATHDVETLVQGWTGRYRIDLPPLVVDPALAVEA